VDQCEVYIVKRGDTLYQIAKRYDLTVNEIVAANPQITNPNVIYPGQKICISVSPGGPRGPIGPRESEQELGVLSIGFYNQEGVLLPQENGVALLAPTTLVIVTFTKPLTHGFLFFTPGGTEAFLNTQLIGITISEGAPILQFQWQVPPALLGSVFVIGCCEWSCTQSESINVYSPEC
jgi:spore coat assembly protein SafA